MTCSFVYVILRSAEESPVSLAVTTTPAPGRPQEILEAFRTGQDVFQELSSDLPATVPQLGVYRTGASPVLPFAKMLQLPYNVITIVTQAFFIAMDVGHMLNKGGFHEMV